MFFQEYVIVLCYLLFIDLVQLIYGLSHLLLFYDVQPIRIKFGIVLGKCYKRINQSELVIIICIGFINFYPNLFIILLIFTLIIVVIL